jgi:hypothetical protein
MDDQDDPKDGPRPDPPPMPSPPSGEVRGIPIGPGGPGAPAAGGSSRIGGVLMVAGGIAVILGAFLPSLSVTGDGGTTTFGGIASVGFGLLILAGFAIAKGIQGIDPSRIRMRLATPILTGLLMLIPLWFHWSDVHSAADLVNAAGGSASIGIGFWIDALGVLAVLVGGAIMQFGDDA